MNFSEFDFSPALRRNLAKYNFSQPTPVQAQAIPAALDGRDVVGTAQTGTGKTLAFLLPILDSILKAGSGAPTGPVALVLSPTRELTLQIHEALLQMTEGTSIRSAVVVGGMSEGQQLKALRSGAQVILATPGRLNDYLDRRLVHLNRIRTFVLDEADRMLDMGFLPAIRTIAKALPVDRQTLLFSATIEPSTAHLIDTYVKDPVRVAIGSTAKPAEQVDLHWYEVEQDAKLGLLTDLLQREQGTFLVFARTKHGTDRLAQKLERAGLKAGRIHGDRTQAQRNQALAGFKDGRYRVLVATDVAARGIHVDGIAHVVNYDLPKAPEDFVHRVGRTGRAGARGVASTFSTRVQRSEMRKLESALKLDLKPQVVGGAAAGAVAVEAASSSAAAGPSGRQRVVMSFAPGRRMRRSSRTR